MVDKVGLVEMEYPIALWLQGAYKGGYFLYIETPHSVAAVVLVS